MNEHHWLLVKHRKPNSPGRGWPFHVTARALYYRCRFDATADGSFRIKCGRCLHGVMYRPDLDERPKAKCRVCGARLYRPDVVTKRNTRGRVSRGTRARKKR